MTESQRSIEKQIGMVRPRDMAEAVQPHTSPLQLITEKLTPGCHDQRAAFSSSFSRTSFIIREIVLLSTLNNWAISAWLFSPARIILIASACCVAESL